MWVLHWFGMVYVFILVHTLYDNYFICKEDCLVVPGKLYQEIDLCSKQNFNLMASDITNLSTEFTRCRLIVVRYFGLA